MTPASARAKWRRRIHKDGETVTLRRVVPNATPIERQVKARVMGYAPEELIGGINQGDRKVFILAEDVEEVGFPVPLRTGGGDQIVVRNRAMTIQVIDDNTHRIRGVLIAYEIRISG
jgi:hypothetical protein